MSKSVKQLHLSDKTILISLRRKNMSKFYMNLLLTMFVYSIHADEPKSELPKDSQPMLEDAIHLFKTRDLFEQLNIQKELEQACIQLTAEQIEMLKNIITATKIKEATGRQVPEIGHDNQRKVIYSGATTKPSHIVLTFSGQETLEDTVESLKKQRFGHNFIIGTDGKIYPVTKEDETIEEGLLHRPFAVGVAGKVIDGNYEERDMNAASITISVVGKDINPATKEQEEALTQLIQWLSKKFEIKPYNVVDYGTIALPYGRRNTQENLPWQSLAEKGLTIWPKTSSMQEEEANNPVDTYPLVLSQISCAFRKIGFLCPVVINHEQEDFKAVVTTFQKHYKCLKQDGTLTRETVNKLFDIIRQLDSIEPKFKDIFPVLN